MSDIKSPNLIIAKGFLSLTLGILASGILLLTAGSLRVAVLLAIAIWAFCRFYYFAFYVIEHYVDKEYRFAGLGSFASYMLSRWRGANGETQRDEG